MKHFIKQFNLLLFLLLCLDLNSQTSCSLIGEDENDFLFEMHQPTDGILITVGHTKDSSTGEVDLYCSRFEGVGDQEWSKTIDFGGDETFGGSLLTEDNKLVIVGTLKDNGLSQIVIVCLDAVTGAHIWDRKLSLDDANLSAADVLQLPNDNFRVIGNLDQLFSFTAVFQSASGNYLNSHTFNFGLDHTVQQAVLTDDGVAIIASDNSEMGGFFFYKVKTSSDVVKRVYFGDSETDDAFLIPRDIMELPDGSFAVVGTKIDQNDNISMGFVLKLTQDGTPSMGNNIRQLNPRLGVKRTSLESIDFNEDGYVVAGKFNYHQFLANLDESLGIIDHGIYNDSTLYDVQTMNSGDIISAGYTIDVDNNDGFVTKTNSDLTSCCSEIFNPIEEGGELCSLPINPIGIESVMAEQVEAAVVTDYGEVAVICSDSPSQQIAPSKQNDIEFLPTYSFKQGNLTIQVYEEVVGGEFTIYSLDGKLLNRGLIESHQINVNLKGKYGVYVLKIEKGDEIYTEKFLYSEK